MARVLIPEQAVEGKAPFEAYLVKIVVEKVTLVEGTNEGDCIHKWQDEYWLVADDDADVAFATAQKIAEPFGHTFPE